LMFSSTEWAPFPSLSMLTLESFMSMEKPSFSVSTEAL
jgi:hypothetical protein